MTTAERMKARRKELGLSAEYLAEKLGCSPATIYRYENGYIEKMPLDILVPIANALHVSPSYLMGWDDSASSSVVSDNSPVSLVNADPELTSYLEELRARPEMRMLFSVAKGATKEDVEKAVAIIEALRKTAGK